MSTRRGSGDMTAEEARDGAVMAASGVAATEEGGNYRPALEFDRAGTEWRVCVKNFRKKKRSVCKCYGPTWQLICLLVIGYVPHLYEFAPAEQVFVPRHPTVV
jgi:hypothetical protein